MQCLTVVCKILPQTNTLPQRACATHKRDAKTTWRVVIGTSPYRTTFDAMEAALLQLISEWPLAQHFNWRVVSQGFDADNWYFNVAGQPK
jgi:hypothetical protein